MQMSTTTVIRGVILLHKNDFLFSHVTIKTVWNRIWCLESSILLSCLITLQDDNSKEITKMGLLLSRGHTTLQRTLKHPSTGRQIASMYQGCISRSEHSFSCLKFVWKQSACKQFLKLHRQISARPMGYRLTSHHVNEIWKHILHNTVDRTSNSILFSILRLFIKFISQTA
jgi:hypothetical protein